MKKKEKSEFDFSQTTLQIKTSSSVGSNEMISVRFFETDENQAGGLVVVFEETLKYKIIDCHDGTGHLYFPNKFKNFGGAEKVWTINRAVGHLKLECNGVIVFDKEMSESECESVDRDKWDREATKISFLHYDSASLQYRQWVSAGGCNLAILQDFCSLAYRV